MGVSVCVCVCLCVCKKEHIDYYTYLKIFLGGTCRVMVIIIGNGGARGVMVSVAGDTSSNPGPDWLHFT